MIHNTFDFTLNNTKLFGQYWQPKRVKAVVVLVHGMGEHSSRYEESVVVKLVENSFAVVAYDNFGHGKTEGKRGHCPSYLALIDAVEIVIKKASELFPNQPKYLYGHSMGGNLVINYVLRRKHELAGTVASSPFLRLAFKPPKWKLLLGRAIMKILPSFTLPSELEVDAISRIPNQVKRYVNDSMVHDKVSPMFSFPLIKTGEWAIEHSNKLESSMLVLHGTGDRIIDYKGSEEFAKKSKNVTLKLFQGGYHELHHDLCKEEFMQTVLDWLNNKL